MAKKIITAKEVEAGSPAAKPSGMVDFVSTFNFLKGVAAGIFSEEEFWEWTGKLPDEELAQLAGHSEVAIRRLAIKAFSRRSSPIKDQVLMLNLDDPLVGVEVIWAIAQEQDYRSDLLLLMFSESSCDLGASARMKLKSRLRTWDAERLRKFILSSDSQEALWSTAIDALEENQDARSDDVLIEELAKVMGNGNPLMLDRRKYVLGALFAKPWNNSVRKLFIFLDNLLQAEEKRNNLDSNSRNPLGKKEAENLLREVCRMIPANSPKVEDGLIDALSDIPLPAIFKVSYDLLLVDFEKRIVDWDLLTLERALAIKWDRLRQVIMAELLIRYDKLAEDSEQARQIFNIWLSAAAAEDSSLWLPALQVLQRKKLIT